MPYKIRKLPNINKFRVYNVDTKEIFSKSTTKSKAQKQLKLLRYIAYKEKKK